MAMHSEVITPASHLCVKFHSINKTELGNKHHAYVLYVGYVTYLVYIERTKSKGVLLSVNHTSFSIMTLIFIVFQQPLCALHK